jgi:hypothetical protein
MFNNELTQSTHSKLEQQRGIFIQENTTNTTDRSKPVVASSRVVKVKRDIKSGLTVVKPENFTRFINRKQNLD